MGDCYLVIGAGAIEKARGLNDVALPFFGGYGTFFNLVAVSGIVGSLTLVHIYKLECVGRYPLATSFQLIEYLAPAFKQRLDTPFYVGSDLGEIIFMLGNLD